MNDWDRNFLHRPFLTASPTGPRDVIDLYRPSPFTTRWTDQILQSVEIHFGVTVGEMKGAKRQRRIAFARFAAMHLIHKYRHYSLPKIGSMFGGRDHTTVMHALRRVKRLEVMDLEFAEKLHGAETFLIDDDTSKVWPNNVIEYLQSGNLVTA
jgi:hypothetical protein